MGSLYRRTRNGKRSNWIAEYTDHAGRRVSKSTRTADKKTAQQILSHWETETAKRISGMIDPRAERIAGQSQRMIGDHLTEFVASLRSAGRSSVHVGRTEKRIQTVIDASAWVLAADITSESVERFAAGLRSQGRGNQTVAHYLQAVKQFSRWLMMHNRIPHDPLLSTKKPSPRADRRRERRMLLPAEWPWLRDAAGPRAIIYETAIQTGLRSGELRSLKPGHVHHAARPPYVTVSSGSTKDGSLARQYITAKLAKALASHKPASRTVLFDLPDEYGMADMIRGDLAAARNAWLDRPDATDEDAESDFLLATNDAGESLDFHALRHTCGAWLAIRRVHPKTIQTVMRHKTITLTMDTYGHLFPGAEPEAIDQIGQLLRQ